LDHALPGLLRQPVIGERKDPGAKRVPDQRNLRYSPTGRVSFNHHTEVIGDLLWRLTAPEVVETVPADYRHAIGAEFLRDGFVDITPTAVARENDRQNMPVRNRGSSTSGKPAITPFASPGTLLRWGRNKAAIASGMLVSAAGLSMSNGVPAAFGSSISLP